MKTNYLQGVLFCLVATVVWGTTFPLMTSVLRHIDPFTFTAMRYSIAGVAFLILLLNREGLAGLSLKGERVFLAWFLGSCGFAGFGFLVFLGQQLSGPTGALSASIMMATMPMLGLLVSWAVRGVRPPLASFLFIFLSFCGVSLVLTRGDYAAVLAVPSNYAPDLLIILGALCWVIYTVGASFFPAWSVYRYTTITTLLGMVTVLGVNIILIAFDVITLPSASTVLTVAPHLIYMALIAGFVGVLSWNMGNKIVTPMNGVLFMDVVPTTTFIISAFTGVAPKREQIIGASLTASALILNNLYQRYRVVRQNRLDALELAPDLE